MSVKNDLDRIEKRLGGDRESVLACEGLSHRGLFKVHNYDDLGLLTEDQVRAHFEDRDVDLVFMVYVDNWRGENEREE